MTTPHSITWLLIVAACSADARPAPRPTPTRGAHRVRVATYNVNFGGRGDPAGVAAIASAHADIAVFQETTPAWETALVGGLGADLPYHRFQVTDTAYAAGGLGVMSRWPILRVDTLPAPRGGLFFAHRIVIDAPGGPIQVLDVHLRPPMSDRGSWVVGYFTTGPDRAREARAHLAALDRALPTIVAGDFNEEDGGDALAVFRAAGFDSALPRFEPDVKTWRWPVGPMTLRFRLDHVLYDRRFRALDAGVIDAGRSDHQPVWAVLERVE